MSVVPVVRGKNLVRFTTAAVAIAVVATTFAGAAVAEGGKVGPGGCPAPGVTGRTTVTIASQGANYPVTVYVPAARRTPYAPLVINLHGSNSNGGQQLDRSGMASDADRDGYLVAVPDGAVSVPDSPGRYAWNIPGVPLTDGTYPPLGTRDDVRFLRDTINGISATLCADPARVYLTGFSGGGRMASYFGCHATDAVAAIAPVAGLRAGTPGKDQPTAPQPDCLPTRPLPVLTFHGELDAVNPYTGGGPVYWQYSVAAALARWADLNHCSDRSKTRQVTEHVTRVSYLGCRWGSTVEAYVASDAGHTWPGSTAMPPSLGPVNTEIDANELMWRFFRDHRLPGPTGRAPESPQ